MKIKSKYYLSEREGETRIRRKFLWRPRCFEETYVRWLEFAYIIERVIKMDIGGTCQYGYYGWYWRETGFYYPQPTANRKFEED